jgi:hypothetical protein
MTLIKARISETLLFSLAKASLQIRIELPADRTTQRGKTLINK